MKDLSKRGVPTQELINIYEKWGHGGYGVIVTGNICVDPRHLESAGNLIVSKENTSLELKSKYEEMAKVSKFDGAVIIAQISHAGSQTPRAINEHPLAVSALQLVSKNVKAGKPVPLTRDQVKTEVVDRFVYTAKFLFEAGFDGVEIHAAHGFLLSQFLSSSTNKRNDEYGGSIENRTRVIIEIYERIREEIPASTGFIIGVKMNCIEHWKDGLTVEEAAAVCSIMERCGLDFVELSGSPMSHKNEESRRREGYFLAYAQKIRPVLKNTILYVTGGFRTAAAMVAAINSNATDGVGLGRPTTAEPDFAIKILCQGILSAADIKVDQDDFFMTYLVCIAQMGQMARKSMSSLKNVCDGIADLSRKEEAENFKKLVSDYVREITKLTEENKPVYGVFQYSSLY